MAEIDMTRLRPGEVIAGLGGVLLLGSRGRRELGGLSLITGLAAFALSYFQATRRAPALPAALSVIVTVLGGATVAGLLRGAVAGRPHAIGLLAAAAVTGGGYASMRQEGGTAPAALGELETITLEP